MAEATSAVAEVTAIADAERPTIDRHVDLNALFQDAYDYSCAHSWYKHYHIPETVYVNLEPNARGHMKLSVMHASSRGNQLPVNAISPTVSLKYPVELTGDLGGHDGPAPRKPRYMFDRYLRALKDAGLVNEDATQLSFARDAVLDDDVARASQTLRSCKYNHEKYRMIGLLVQAACSIANDLGIQIVDTLPYPAESNAWDYLRSIEEVNERKQRQ